LGVERAQPHPMREKFDRAIRIAVPGAQEATEEPRGREIRIEHQRSVDQADSVIKIARQVAECSTAPRERNRVVHAQLDATPSHPDTLGNFFVAVGHPAVDFAPKAAPRRHCMSRREGWVEIQRAMELRYRFAHGLLRTAMQVCYAAQVVVVSVET